MLSSKETAISKPTLRVAKGAKQKPRGMTTAARDRALDALLARHLMLVAMDARAEGDLALAEHLLDTGYQAYDGE